MQIPHFHAISTRGKFEFWPFLTKKSVREIIFELPSREGNSSLCEASLFSNYPVHFRICTKLVIMCKIRIKIKNFIQNHLRISTSNMGIHLCKENWIVVFQSYSYLLFYIIPILFTAIIFSNLIIHFEINNSIAVFI